MESELEKITSEELMAIYTKNREFITYMDKEYQEIQKKREEK